jgi:enoyl-CoA hydratase
MPGEKVRVETSDRVWVISINRPERRNAVDSRTATLLREAFAEFEADPAARVAVLTGTGGHFCAGADLKALASGDKRPIDTENGPMGPTLMTLTKPTIAAVEGYAVGGGLELAAFCDLRVASESAVFGVFNRRFGVPLVDGGTVRLPRLVGLSRALDMILTGRPVPAREAYDLGLVNYLVPEGKALERAASLATDIASFPWECLRHDRMATLENWSLGLQDALRNEALHGREVVASGEPLSGAAAFKSGKGRHGSRLSPE